LWKELDFAYNDSQGVVDIERSLFALDTPGSEIALFPENIKCITSSVLKYTAKINLPEIQ